jgi:hypothetical protein
VGEIKITFPKLPNKNIVEFLGTHLETEAGLEGFQTHVAS